MNFKNIFAPLAIAATATVLFSACNKNDDTPQPVEQELITTLRLNVTGTGFSQNFTYRVENGIGSATPGTVQIDTVKLKPSTTYNVAITVLNEKATPAEDVTTEIQDEKDHHLFLYESAPQTGAGSFYTNSGNTDNNGQPFNQTVQFTTGAAGSGKITLTLIHEPTNKSGNSPSTAGGETDAEAIFPLLIQP